MCQYTLACQHFGVNPAVARHQVKCPVHNDSTASLSIARGKKVELVVHCHAGCLPKDIIAALDLPLPVHEMTTPEVPATPSRIVAEYRYTNAERETVAIKQRLDPKSFRWQSYDAAERRMRSGLPADGGQARIPLYRLPAVLEAAGKRLVMVCEGEKDCDALTAFGAVATCNPEGASGAASAYTTERWAALTRAHVVIFPDNDDPGRKHAQRIAEAIYPLAASVRIVALPDLPEKGDASDWLEKGGSLEALSAIIGEAKIWTPHPTEIVSLEPIVDPRRPRPLAMEDWLEEAQAMTEEVKVIPTPFPSLNDACRRGGARQGWRLGWHVVLAGSPGEGKTTILLNCAVYAALKGKRVGIISLEMSRDELMAIMLTIATQTPERELEAMPGVLNETFVDRAKTFQAMLDESGGAIFLIDLPRSDLPTVERAIRQMVEDGCELICTDYMQRITVPGKPDDYGRMTDISNTLQGIAKQDRIVSLALSQFNRGTSSSGYAPKSQGLKGSSALEDDANQILLINGQGYFRYSEDFDGLGPGAAFQLKISKNRHGPLRDLNLFMSHNTLAVIDRGF